MDSTRTEHCEVRFFGADFSRSGPRSDRRERGGPTRKRCAQVVQRDGTFRFEEGFEA